MILNDPSAPWVNGTILQFCGYISVVLQDVWEISCLNTQITTLSKNAFTHKYVQNSLLEFWALLRVIKMFR